MKLGREQQQATAESVRISKMSQGETEDTINISKQTESRVGKEREKEQPGAARERQAVTVQKTETSCVHTGRVLWQPGIEEVTGEFTAGCSEDMT